MKDYSKQHLKFLYKYSSALGANNALVFLWLLDKEGLRKKYSKISKDGYWHFTKSEIAEMCGLSRKNVNHSLFTLETLGFIHPLQRSKRGYRVSIRLEFRPENHQGPLVLPVNFNSKKRKTITNIAKMRDRFRDL